MKHFCGKRCQEETRFHSPGPSRYDVLLGVGLLVLLLVGLLVFGCAPSVQVRQAEQRVEQFLTQHQVVLHAVITTATYVGTSIVQGATLAQRGVGQ